MRIGRKNAVWIVRRLLLLCATALSLLGFAPRSALLPGEPRQNAGIVGVSTGAAASLRFVSAADGEAVAPTTVEVVRAAELERLRSERAPGAPESVARGITGAGGWIRFSGLPPEDVVFAVVRAGGRYREYTPVYRLRATEPLIVDPLKIAPAAKAVVSVSTSEENANELRVAAVDFEPRGELAWPIHAPFHVAVPEGRTSITVDDVPPGQWRVSAVARLPRGTAIKTGSRDIDVPPGGTLDVSLAIAERLFRGRVTRADHGMHGVINLKPHPFPSERRSVVARMEDDGRFAVLLEAPGEYSAVIQTPRGGARIERGITFANSRETKIELPDGTIEGKVIAPGGAPVAGADVVAARSGASNALEVSEGFARSGADGKFVVDSLGGGTWTLSASQRRLTSDPLTVELHGDEQLSGIAIVVERTHTVAIRVADARGINVHGAFVGLEFAAGNILGVQAGRADDEAVARFNLKVPPSGVRFANATVSAPDGTRASALISIHDDDSVAAITLPRATGDVSLKRPKGWSDARWPRLVAPDGSAIPVPTRPGNAAFQDDRTLLLRGIPTGRWRYVEARSNADALQIAKVNFAAVRALAEFEVRAGQVVNVSLPVDD